MARRIEQSKDYLIDNWECATIIVRESEKYAGLMLLWARMFLAKNSGPGNLPPLKVKQPKRGQQKMF